MSSSTASSPPKTSGGKTLSPNKPPVKLSKTTSASSSPLNHDQSKKKSKKGKSSHSQESYTLYIYKVLKSIHNKTVDTFERISSEASHLCVIHNKDTLSAREVQSAVKLVLPGELARHAISEGTKAVNKYTGNKLPTAKK